MPSPLFIRINKLTVVAFVMIAEIGGSNEAKGSSVSPAAIAVPVVLILFLAPVLVIVFLFYRRYVSPNFAAGMYSYICCICFIC